MAFSLISCKHFVRQFIIFNVTHSERSYLLLSLRVEMLSSSAFDKQLWRLSKNAYCLCLFGFKYFCLFVLIKQKGVSVCVTVVGLDFVYVSAFSFIVGRTVLDDKSFYARGSTRYFFIPNTHNGCSCICIWICAHVSVAENVCSVCYGIIISSWEFSFSSSGKFINFWIVRGGNNLSKIPSDMRFFNYYFICPDYVHITSVYTLFTSRSHSLSRTLDPHWPICGGVSWAFLLHNFLFMFDMLATK